MQDPVSEWLERLGLGKYSSNFTDNDIDLQLLADLTDTDLKELGISSLGHRKKILAAIETPSHPEPESGTPAISTAIAERRQLTIMFCDLAESTELSQLLDPEDLREINRAYQDACKASIESYEGYVARYMGDGVLAYFGFPQAHEDDAERAIRAGLALVASVADLNASFAEGQNFELAVRVGIATGAVVVGDLIGESASQESAVVGETPNLAARLQALASRNSVVIGPGTHALVAGRFDYEHLGQQNLKGIAEPVPAWRVIAAAATDSRFAAAHPGGLTPLVGREHELGLLLERWEQAKDGDGQVVLLSGEAGIGKSRITDALRERIELDNPDSLHYQCSPYHINSALHPIIEQIERTASFETDDPHEVKLDKLESLLASSAADIEAATSLIAILLSLPSGNRYRPLEITADRQKELILESLVAQMEALSQKKPVLLIFEDAHWADPTSLELLELTIAKAQSIPMLAIITYRPEFTPRWSSHTHVTSLTLNRFARSLAMKMVDRVSGGKSLPENVQQQIIDKTDGVPLFVEELTKTLLESDLLTEKSDRYVLSGSLSELALPTTLHDSLMARLDRLTMGKQIAQTAATIGRVFSRKLLEMVCGMQQADIDEALNELIDSGLVFTQGSNQNESFMFKHALVQEAAYESLLKATRRGLHAHIAEALLTRFTGISDTQPELLARHYSAADDRESAVKYWLQAGRRSLQGSADQEAIGHLTSGLGVLLEMPESTERADSELDFQLALCGPIMITRGWGSQETAATFARARELCTVLGETKKIRPVLNGEYMRELTLGRFHAARDKAAELLQLGNHQRDDEAIIQGHRILGWGSLYLGEFTVARNHSDKVLELYDPDEHEELKFHYAHDPRVAALCVRAIVQELCGYSEQSRQTTTEALDYARKINHTSTLAYALMLAGALPATIRQDTKLVEEYADEILLLSRQMRSDVWLGFGKVFSGWSSGTQLASEDGLELLLQGLNILETASPNPLRPFFLALLAEVHFHAGNTNRALDSLTNAVKLIEQSGERMWEAGIYGLFGKFLFTEDLKNTQEAESMCVRALNLATEQGAKTLQLRAAICLTGVLQKQGRQDEAQKILAPVYEEFTEGFDTPDLIEAKELLTQVA